MKRKRHTPEEIIKKLREAATFLAGGQSVEEVCKKLEVSPPTDHRWKEQDGGAREETVKRLRELEKENGRLKRIVRRWLWTTQCSRNSWREPSGARQPKGGALVRRAAPEGAGNVVSPERKRQAVLHLQERLSVSERRACCLTAQPRATQRYRGVRRVSASRPRAGYRMAAAYLGSEGWTLNDKGAQRLWRQEGLKVPRRQRKLRSLGSSENSAQRLRATRVNEVWSYDFVFDQTEDGRRLK